MTGVGVVVLGLAVAVRAAIDRAIAADEAGMVFQGGGDPFPKDPARIAAIQSAGLRIRPLHADKVPPGLPNAAYRNDGKPKPVGGSSEDNWAPAAVSLNKETDSGLSLALTPWPAAGDWPTSFRRAFNRSISALCSSISAWSRPAFPSPAAMGAYWLG